VAQRHGAGNTITVAFNEVQDASASFLRFLMRFFGDPTPKSSVVLSTAGRADLFSASGDDPSLP
jgi:hypothetical protein